MRKREFRREVVLAPDAPTYVVYTNGVATDPLDLGKFADAVARFHAEIDAMVKPSRGMVTLVNQHIGKRLRRFDADKPARRV